MQKLLKPLILLALLICIFTSCKKKFEDGPRFSLRSPENRLLGDWEFANIVQDGVEITNNFKDSINVGLRFDCTKENDGGFPTVKLLNISNKQTIGRGYFVFNDDQLYVKMAIRTTQQPNNTKWYPFVDYNYINFTVNWLSNKKMDLFGLFETHEITIELKKI